MRRVDVRNPSALLGGPDFGAYRYSVPAARIHSSDTRTGLFVPRGGLVPGSLLGWKRSAFCAKTVT